MFADTALIGEGILVADKAGSSSGEAVVTDGGNRCPGGAQSGSAEMLEASDAEWAAQRERRGH
jgi:hypothetical protein